VAAEQIRSWLEQLEQMDPPASMPTFTCDAGYDPVQLSLTLDGLSACLLVRLRAGRCFYADPTSQPQTGRPRRHGVKFVCEDPTTWPLPRCAWSTTDPQHGVVCLQAWSHLHAAPQNHATRGTRQPRPLVRGTLIRLEVTHLPRPTKRPQPLWFWWYGPIPPDLAAVWRAYLARFSIEHTFRFFKQTLHWTTPKLRAPQAADRLGPLDMVAHPGLESLALGARRGCRPPLTLAAAVAARTAHASAGAVGLCAPPPAFGQPGGRAKTLWPVARTAQGQTLPPRPTVSGGQIDTLIHRSLRLFAVVLALPLDAGQLVWVKI
jgi:hypothetical protein